jgi:NTP pyrophosphatase (non-canonical NTP hydrolase)
MMDANTYQKECLRTECDQSVAMRRYMTEMAIRLNHSVLGLTGEVGELATAVEKWLHYGRTLDMGNLIEEFGDCLWYLCLGMSAVGIKMEHVMEANLRKLKARYPDRYTDERASQRDLEAERKALDFTISQEGNVGDQPRGEATGLFPQSGMKAGVTIEDMYDPAKPHPSHQWAQDKPQTTCVRCGAYRHLSSGFMPCLETLHGRDLTPQEVENLKRRSVERDFDMDAPSAPTDPDGLRTDHKLDSDDGDRSGS